MTVNQFLPQAPEQARHTYRSLVSQSELSSGLVAAGHPRKVQQYPNLLINQSEQAVS